MSRDEAPREFAAQLREILNRDPKLGLVLVPARGVLRLRDRQSGMVFDVRGVSDEAVAVRVDAIQHLKALASKDRLKLVCDYLLVGGADGDADTQAMLLELKRTVGYDSKPREQLRRSLPILRYLQSACEVHFEQQLALDVRYVLAGSAYHPTFDKQPVTFGNAQPRRENYHDIAITVLVGRGESFSTLVA